MKYDEAAARSAVMHREPGSFFDELGKLPSDWLIGKYCRRRLV